MAWNQFFHGWGEDDDLLASKNFIPLRFVPSPLFVPMNNSSLKNFEHVPLRMLNPYISFVLLTKTRVLAVASTIFDDILRCICAKIREANWESNDCNDSFRSLSILFAILLRIRI